MEIQRQQCCLSHKISVIKYKIYVDISKLSTLRCNILSPSLSFSSFYSFNKFVNSFCLPEEKKKTPATSTLSIIISNRNRWFAAQSHLKSTETQTNIVETRTKGNQKAIYCLVVLEFFFFFYHLIVPYLPMAWGREIE